MSTIFLVDKKNPVYFSQVSFQIIDNMCGIKKVPSTRFAQAPASAKDGPARVHITNTLDHFSLSPTLSLRHSAYNILRGLFSPTQNRPRRVGWGIGTRWLMEINRCGVGGEAERIEAGGENGDLLSGGFYLVGNWCHRIVNNKVIIFLVLYLAEGFLFFKLSVCFYMFFWNICIVLDNLIEDLVWRAY